MELVGSPAYGGQLQALERGMAHHVFLGRSTVLAALKGVTARLPEKRVAAEQVAADLGLRLRDPGNCDPSRHDYFQKRVDLSCKPLQAKCTAGETCASVSQKMARFSDCADARQQINSQCFAGGDRGHQMAYTSARQQAAICQGMSMSCLP